jgi:hypothetical protein
LPALPDVLAVLGLLALAAWQLWPSAGPGYLPQNLDLMLQYVPNAAYLQRSLLDARLPLWNPYLGAGMPFAADPGTATWYLPNWPALLALPLYVAVRVIVWGHLIWAALGTYVFLRRAVGTGVVASSIGAAAFALTTWLPGLAGMPVVLSAVAWLPWLLFLADRVVRAGGGWVALLGLAGALQLVAGWPAGAYLTWMTIAALLGRYGRREVWPRGVLRLVGAGFLTALVGAVLLLPALELITQTNYAETRPVDRVATEGYLTLLSWFRPSGGSGTLESSQLYLGLAPLVLAVVALGWRRQRDTLVFGAIALVSLLLAFGTHGPLFAVFYRWLPGFRIVYLPARLGIVAAFALAVLAALGVQRLGEGRWRPGQAARLTAVVAVAVAFVLVQFWHSEGYDDFRRLLTNVGRLAGGPFVTREQELQYLLFGGAALAAVAGATVLPHRVVAGLLLVLTVADLGLAQWRAAPPGFEPAGWYGRAWAAAGVSPSSAVPLGSRTTGLQWHGTRHFLADFPATSDPALLPPNLALLTGVRDAQAYNPLLLRRAVDYFGRINGGRTDDHWLWIEDFRSPLVDALAVVHVRTGAPGATWRLSRPLLGKSVVLQPGASPPDGGAVVSGPATPVWQAPVGPASDGRPGRLYVVSYLGEATAVPQGRPAIEIVVGGRGADGDVQRRFILRAGLETAEWAYGRPDVRARAGHSQAPLALETRLVGAVGGSYAVYEYLAAVDVEEMVELRTVSARALIPGVTAYVQGLYLEPRPDRRFTPAPDGVFNLAARPRAVLDGGTVQWLLDRPEEVVLAVTATRSGTLILGDSYYPGWQASIDGAATAIVPAEGLFRAVAVGQGTHQVAFSYRPTTFRIGAALSLIGLVIAVATGCLPRFHRPRTMLPP